MDYGAGKERILVIVFECWDLPSRWLCLDCLVLGIRYSAVGMATRS